jgi:hypothetical protein
MQPATRRRIRADRWASVAGGVIHLNNTRKNQWGGRSTIFAIVNL